MADAGESRSDLKDRLQRSRQRVNNLMTNPESVIAREAGRPQTRRSLLGSSEVDQIREERARRGRAYNDQVNRAINDEYRTQSGLEERLSAPGAEMRKAGMKKGGAVKKMAKGGKVSSAGKRADGLAIKGKTKGRLT